MGTDDPKNQHYMELVTARKSCRACEGLTNPSACENGALDCSEIGAWSAWQGNLNAEIMVVGQDWGDVGWFGRACGRSTDNSCTNTTLVALLEAAGCRIRLPRETENRGVAFFTNAILCLKRGGAQSAVNRQWFENCGTRFLQPLIDLVHPRVVVGLGERAYWAILRSYGLKAGKFSEAVRREEPVLFPGGIAVFAVYHCGARTLNINRPREAQITDWQRIGRFLQQANG
jgi:DNA polymerase